VSEQKVVNFSPHPTQWEALNFKTQFGAAICGSQSGKTTVGAVWAGLEIQREMARDDPRPGLIGAPTYKVLRQSTLQKFWEQFPNLQQYFKKQESTIEIPYQNKKGENKIYSIFVRSFDRPLGVEGMSPGWAWLDEFGLCDQLAWTVVKTRMTVTLGRIFITTTPYNTGFLYRDIYTPWKEGVDTRMSIFTWSAYDLADFFDQLAEKEKGEKAREYQMKAQGIREHLLNEKRALSPEEFAKRYMGKFSKMTGLVYNLSENHIIPRETKRWDKVIGGIDWGYHHPAVGVYGLEGDKWYVIGEWAGTKNTTDDIIDACKELQEEFGVSRWYADSANPEKIKQANKGTGLYVVGFKKQKQHRQGDVAGTSRSSIEFGISYIQQLIREGRFKVFEDLNYHLNEFESYHYSEEPQPGKEDIPDKKDGNDHFMDAMRYAIIGDAPARRQQPKKPKNLLDTPWTQPQSIKGYQFV
jgi:hypothetical protein